MEDLPQHFQGENEIILGNRTAIVVASTAEVLSTPLALSISNEVLFVFIFQPISIQGII
ncbi:hypothetical protein [Burkholderia sp. BCC1993]|uniref:hypothetical protein n=1 Tax=Burkholderia sp. BCC1993 TaxID=2817444 RepID=UPI002AB11E3D|nr:hypothetical protein [Burkholderia sp. BCC1993]